MAAPGLFHRPLGVTAPRSPPFSGSPAEKSLDKLPSTRIRTAGLADIAPMASLITDELRDAYVGPDSSFSDRVARLLLAPLVYAGLLTRVAVAGTALSDHVLFCSWESGPSGKLELAGIAEVSLQPLDCSGSAPIASPTFAKRFALRMSRDRGDVLTPYISNVCVKRGMRRKGIARKLMAACQEHARRYFKDFAPLMHLHVESSNAAAVRLYRSLEYAPLSRQQRDAFLARNGLRSFAGLRQPDRNRLWRLQEQHSQSRKGTSANADYLVHLWRTL